MYKFLALPCLLVTSLFILAETPQEKGLRIAEAMDKANEGFEGESSEMEMVLINAHGDKVTRKLSAKTMEQEKDGDRSLSTFHWPADVKGTRMLTWSHKTGDDDQWLFLPALNRVKRISSRNKSGAFMGSEFSYEDLGSQEVEEYTYLFVKEDNIEGRACQVIERDPVSDKSGYSKEVVWYDNEYKNPLKVEYYDRKGELLKVATFSDYKKLGNYWRPHKILMENVQTKKSSILTFTKRELGQKYDDAQFASDTLADF